jgi:hypothetical protein
MKRLPGLLSSKADTFSLVWHHQIPIGTVSRPIHALNRFLLPPRHRAEAKATAIPAQMGRTSEPDTIPAPGRINTRLEARRANVGAHKH